MFFFFLPVTTFLVISFALVHIVQLYDTPLHTHTQMRHHNDLFMFTVEMNFHFHVSTFFGEHPA